MPVPSSSYSGTTITISCRFASSCMSFVVGPSGIGSTASYQRVLCSAQKYGPVKISCIDRICTPSRPACSMRPRCFSTFASRIVSIFSWVEQACVAWINPHFTTRGMSALRDARLARASH